MNKVSAVNSLRIFCYFLFLLILTACGDQQVSPNQDSTVIGQEYREGEVLVKFKAGTGKLRIQSLHRAIGAGIKKRFATLNIEHVKLPHGLSVQDAIKAYKTNPDVEYTEPNYIVHKAIIPNDTYFSLQWGMDNTGQAILGVSGTADADIDAPEAWDIHTGTGGSTSSPVIVAVIDTGVDYNHEDLKDNIWTNPNEVCGNGLDDDGNGYKDDCIGWNFAYNNSNPMDDDVDGHGTHVAGIIGAVGNNNTGVSGVNWNVKIMPLKFMDSTGSGTIADVIEAIDYAVKMGAKVINASYTYPQECVKTSPSLSERDAIKAAGDSGVLLVAAAGNFGCNNDVYPFYPASHPLNNIISVAASDQNDNKPSWSNYGANSVHVAAPGVNIYSTVRTAIGSYGYMTGTSMASPHVSGLAGLIASYRPLYTYLEIRKAILSFVDEKSSFTNSILSKGRINAYNALSSTLSLPAQPTNLSLTISDSQINLNWTDNSSIEEGYIIESKTDAGVSYSILTILPADTTSYTDISVSLTEGAAYYYRVKAYNSNGESPYSNEISVITPPNAPSNLTASAVSNSQINLSWTDNSSAEDGFEIERKAGFDGIYSQIATAGADVTAYSDTDLSAGTTYYYRVRAYNTAGDSSYSKEASAITQSPSSGGGGGGCFIATAAYGSYLAPEVQVLRKFRDEYLLANFKFQISSFKIEIPNFTGKAFVAFYYKVSPPIADYIREHENLRTVVRFTLTPVVYGIKYIGIFIIVIISFLTVIALVLIRRLGANK